MTAYVFYMGEVEIHPDLPPTDAYTLGTWVCLIQRGKQFWGQLEEGKRINQVPHRGWHKDCHRDWFSKYIDQVPKDFRTQLLILGG